MNWKMIGLTALAIAVGLAATRFISQWVTKPKTA
jgi:hypothetical protein